MNPPPVSNAVFDANLRILARVQPGLLAELESAAGQTGPPAETAEPTLARPSPMGGRRYAVVLGAPPVDWTRRWLEDNRNHPARMMIWEPRRPALRAWLGAADVADALAEERIALFPDDGALSRRLADDWAFAGAWGISVYRCDGIDSEQCAALVRAAESRETAAMENWRVQLNSGGRIQTNILENLPVIARSWTLDAWSGAFRGVPAVVTGAGPSLTENLETLARFPTNALIVAADTALGPMLDRGVQPHFVVVCDPTPLNVRHFERVPSLGPSVLAYLPESHPGVLRRYPNHTRRLCLMDGNSAIIRRFMARAGIQTPFMRGMNAGFCAFSLAHHLGCSQIALIGMDLAVGPDGYSHAGGTANRFLAGPESGNDLVRAEGANGGTVYTFPHFIPVIERFGRFIEGAGLPVFNASYGGARISGARPVPLREWLDHAAGLPPAAFEASVSARPLPSPHAGFAYDLGRMAEEIGRAAKTLQGGLARVEAEAGRAGAGSPPEWTRSIENLRARWLALLNDPAFETGLDTALARERFETLRAEFPPEIRAEAEYLQWLARFGGWFRGALAAAAECGRAATGAKLALINALRN